MRLSRPARTASSFALSRRNLGTIQLRPGQAAAVTSLPSAYAAPAVRTSNALGIGRALLRPPQRLATIDYPAMSLGPPCAIAG